MRATTVIVDELSSIESKPPTKKELAELYIANLAQSTESLMERVIHYKEKVNNAKSEHSRKLYSKKLRKFINDVDTNIAFFAKLQELNDAEDEAIAKQSESK